MAGLIKTAAKAGQPLSEAVVWRHFSQIADALAYMHEKRVMHRDLKPANVFVTETNHVKLGDLGVGRHFSSKTDMVHSTVGTPYYMSPECIQGGGYNFKSDIWSLGCLLYELATLKSPFYSNGLNFYMLGKRIMARQFEPLSDADLARKAANRKAGWVTGVESANPNVEEDLLYCTPAALLTVINAVIRAHEEMSKGERKTLSSEAARLMSPHVIQRMYELKREVQEFM